MFDDIYIVHREDGTSRLVVVLLDESTSKYRFVNITKGWSHICRCQFDTVEDALNDLSSEKNNPRVVSWEKYEGAIK